MPTASFMSSLQQFFATAPKGVESVLASELELLGASQVKQSRAGVRFEGDLRIAYSACLWLRTANRVLLPIAELETTDENMLYQAIREIDWFEHLSSDNTLAVDVNTSQSSIKHSRFGAQKVKDAIVDQFRDRFGTRPSVDLASPDIRINVYLLKDMATVSIDLSGDSLHKRGYRQSGVEAPVKENLAAAILLKTGWPAIAKQGGGLVDPMCGSGTFLIEAALIAANIAPGLLRKQFGFSRWKGHDAAIWTRLKAEAKQQQTNLDELPILVGYDSDTRAIAQARKSAEMLGLIKQIHFEKRELADCIPHAKLQSTPGLFLTNPPYGVRLGELEELKSLYFRLGKHLVKHFKHWKAAVLTGNTELGREIGLRASKIHKLFNGSIPCSLLHFDVEDQSIFQPRVKHSPVVSRSSRGIPKSAATEFSNRIAKNLKKLSPWLIKNDIQCYRIYDKDIPEFAVSIDVYGSYLHVQEYKAPETVDPKAAEERLNLVLEELPAVLSVPRSRIYLKVRQRQSGTQQYQKQNSNPKYHEVTENGCQFLVNFTNYLDTGLFLDHRITRNRIADMAKGKRFMNLFSYTGTATVYAAKGGAASTVSIDASKHYNTWANKNMILNGFRSDNHQIIHSDCLDWIRSDRHRYDLIFLDPPTFSNSKSRQTVFDIQKDHAELIQKAATLLKPNGDLLFSTNYRKFKIDQKALTGLHLEDITPSTIPLDFKRSPKIHQCWHIKKQ